jgi:predicted nucleic acid-binding protein
MFSILGKLESAREEESFRNQLQLRLNRLVALHFDSQAARIMARMAGGLGAADALRMKDSMYAEISRIDSLLKDHPQERATWEEIKHTALEFNEVYNRTMKE